VVREGVTDTELEEASDCKPILLSMLTVSAPDRDQDRVELWPKTMAAGEALNEPITGAVPEQATVVEGVMVTVAEPVAVKVA
jgi:hypothetical protein